MGNPVVKILRSKFRHPTLFFYFIFFYLAVKMNLHERMSSYVLKNPGNIVLSEEERVRVLREQGQERERERALQRRQEEGIRKADECKD